MDRLKNGTQLPNGRITDGDPGTGTPGSVCSAAIGNSWTEEICNSVEDGGQTLDINNEKQLKEAIENAARGVNLVNQANFTGTQNSPYTRNAPVNNGAANVTNKAIAEMWALWASRTTTAGSITSILSDEKLYIECSMVAGEEIAFYNFPINQSSPGPMAVIYPGEDGDLRGKTADFTAAIIADNLSGSIGCEIKISDIVIAETPGLNVTIIKDAPKVLAVGEVGKAFKCVKSIGAPLDHFGFSVKANETGTIKIEFSFPMVKSGIDLNPLLSAFANRNNDLAAINQSAWTKNFLNYFVKKGTIGVGTTYEYGDLCISHPYGFCKAPDKIVFSVVGSWDFNPDGNLNFAQNLATDYETEVIRQTDFETILRLKLVTGANFPFNDGGLYEVKAVYK